MAYDVQLFLYRLSFVVESDIANILTNHTPNYSTQPGLECIFAWGFSILEHSYYLIYLSI